MSGSLKLVENLENKFEKTREEVKALIRDIFGRITMSILDANIFYIRNIGSIYISDNYKIVFTMSDINFDTSLYAIANNDFENISFFEAIFDNIKEIINTGEKVYIDDFGTFFIDNDCIKFDPDEILLFLVEERVDIIQKKSSTILVRKLSNRFNKTKEEITSYINDLFYYITLNIAKGNTVYLTNIGYLYYKDNNVLFQRDEMDFDIDIDSIVRGDNTKKYIFEIVLENIKDLIYNSYKVYIEAFGRFRYENGSIYFESDEALLESINRLRDKDRINSIVQNDAEKVIKIDEIIEYISNIDEDKAIFNLQKKEEDTILEEVVVNDVSSITKAMEKGNELLESGEIEDTIKSFDDDKIEKNVEKVEDDKTNNENTTLENDKNLEEKMILSPVEIDKNENNYNNTLISNIDKISKESKKENTKSNKKKKKKKSHAFSKLLLSAILLCLIVFTIFVIRSDYSRKEIDTNLTATSLYNIVNNFFIDVGVQDFSSYTVNTDTYYWDLSKAIYGDSTYWPLLYPYNHIKSDTQIKSGTTILYRKLPNNLKISDVKYFYNILAKSFLKIYPDLVMAEQTNHSIWALKLSAYYDYNVYDDNKDIIRSDINFDNDKLAFDDLFNRYSKLSSDKFGAFVETIREITGLQK